MLAPFHALALSLGLAAALSRRLQTRCWRFPRLGLVRSPLARGQRTRGRLPSCPLPSFPTPALSGVFPTNPRSIKLSRPDLPLPVTPRKHPVHGSIYSPVLYVPSRPSETAIRVRYTAVYRIRDGAHPAAADTMYLEPDVIVIIVVITLEASRTN